MDNPTRRKLSLLFKPLPLLLQLSDTHDGTLPLLPSSFTCLNTFSSIAFFFLSSAYSDLKLQLTYGPTKERPVPTTLVGLIQIQYKDPRQDLTATQPRASTSGSGLSSPAPKQPYTKPFSGLPSGLKVTSPYREAGGTFGGRPGIVYPLLPRATRPDTKLGIDAAALPKSAALGQQSRPPTVLDLEEVKEKENQPPSQSKRQPCKRRRHRSTGVYRPSKRLPPRGRWCD